jgi:O-acetyl-ADP-ribose deacetylase (regulator of RNase III)
MIIYKKGNLLDLASEGLYDIVLHGANCFCKMDDGIALQFALAFPEILHADFLTEIADKNKLGTYTEANVTRLNKNFKILNCYTQYAYAGFDIEISEFFDYQAYEKVLIKIAKQFPHAKIGMPLIGTGHAGGDMEQMLAITEKILSNHNVEIIIFDAQNLPKKFNSLKNQITLFILDIKNKFFKNKF